MNTTDNPHKHMWSISYESVDGYDLFITSIDAYSCFGYIYLIKERKKAPGKFCIFKAKVEN
jgi:hypothetical protein